MSLKKSLIVGVGVGVIVLLSTPALRGFSPDHWNLLSAGVAGLSAYLLSILIK
jgi:hypothetical protein